MGLYLAGSLSGVGLFGIAGFLYLTELTKKSNFEINYNIQSSLRETLVLTFPFYIYVMETDRSIVAVLLMICSLGYYLFKTFIEPKESNKLNFFEIISLIFVLLFIIKDIGNYQWI